VLPNGNQKRHPEAVTRSGNQKRQKVEFFATGKKFSPRASRGPHGFSFEIL
jgi:hypothetical protein